MIGGGTIWWLLRYHGEKSAVYHFLNAVVSGDMQKAYGMWSRRILRAEGFCERLGPGRILRSGEKFQRDGNIPAAGRVIGRGGDRGRESLPAISRKRMMR